MEQKIINRNGEFTVVALIINSISHLSDKIP